MKNVGFGIIGIGRQGLRLSEHIRKDIKHAKLVAVCRRSKDGHHYSKEHGLKFYSNHQDLLADQDVNAVIITTPSNLHGVQAIDAVKLKKHILIDKPIASSIEEGQKILDLAKKENLTVAVNFPLRVNPVTETLKNNLQHIGLLRKIQVVVSHGPARSKWQSDRQRSNGGVILDLGSHYFDLISFLTGHLPETIDSAYCEEVGNENSGIIDITCEGFSASMVLLRSNSHEVKEIKCSPSNDFETILNNLVHAINKKEGVIADGQAGLDSLKTALSAYEAIKTSRPVRL
jgi:predicted dehydrogenase